MNLELGKVYEDGRGLRWRIVSVNNGQRPDIGPVTGERWEGKNYYNRIFKRDGTTIHKPWDLVKEVNP